MTVSALIIGEEIFSAVSPEEWNLLAGESVSNTPFQSYTYQKAWWTYLGVGELVSVTVYNEDTLIGIGVFNLSDNRLRFNASKEETDYLDIICRADDAETVWEAVFACLCSEACPSWDTFDCWNIPEQSSSREILPRLAASRGFLFSEEVAEVCPVIDTNCTFDEYLAKIDKKQRHEIKRKMRRAAGSDVEIEVISDPAELPQALDDFLELLQKSTPEKRAWLDEFPKRADLFREVAAAALEDGTLLLMFTKINGKRISALFNFCYQDRVWVYNSGIDITHYGNLSLGVVLTAHAIKLGIERGCHTFDFLRGNETYKYRFGAADTTIYRLTLQQQSA